MNEITFLIEIMYAEPTLCIHIGHDEKPVLKGAKMNLTENMVKHLQV